MVIDDPRSNRLHDAVKAELGKFDSRLRTHDFRMVSGEGHINLIFDVSLPADLKGQEKTIRSRLEAALSVREETRVYTVITFDPEVFNEDI